MRVALVAPSAVPFTPGGAERLWWGLTTYVNRIAPASEHTPTLSLGVAANHVAAVTMPLVGGLIWKYAGYNWTFWIGAAAAAASILAAIQIPASRGRVVRDEPQ